MLFISGRPSESKHVLHASSIFTLDLWTFSGHVFTCSFVLFRQKGELSLKKKQRMQRWDFFEQKLHLPLGPINKPDPNSRKVSRASTQHALCVILSPGWLTPLPFCLSCCFFVALVHPCTHTCSLHHVDYRVLSRVLGVSESSEPAEPTGEEPQSTEVNMAVTCIRGQRRPLDLF